MTIGAGALEEGAARQRQSIQAIFEANPDAREYLEQPESMVDEQQFPLVENIAEAVQRFLHNRRPSEDGPNPFNPLTDGVSAERGRAFSSAATATCPRARSASPEATSPLL